MIPVVLFAYSRPNHLTRTLDCLRADNIPLLYVYSDGAADASKQPAVDQVREILHSIDWCELHIIERNDNFGLGRSILTGVTEVIKLNDTIIVFEDDLICVPGTYEYLSTALNHYKDDMRVMSVTGWTHPSVTPSDLSNLPYFDGRSECLVWGTWARTWQGMDQDALSMIKSCRKKKIDINRYGADLPEMAEIERQRNIWAVRFLYWHILNHGLCFRPPWSMVEHIGFDQFATNASDGSNWSNPPLKPCPPIPDVWPEPVEHPDCPILWQTVYPRLNVFKKTKRFIKRNLLRSQ